METILAAFEGAHLKVGPYSGIPFIQHETAQSHLFRVIDYLNPEISREASTNAISKEVMLTLLRCASRLLSNSEYTEEAMALIQNEDSIAILQLGIQDDLSQAN
ncbi:hypothetical protein F5884DRAFT_759012 [Xylogone sp. PMI_703]|nr:hypothetical protein F5884DRAFT_759012 [Xylogone sp. PMI_703]